MSMTLSDYCVEYDRTELLGQWHPEKNGTLNPALISYGSNRKIWWKCPEGHEWLSSIYGRTSKRSGCPYCTGRKVSPGRDFKSVFPDLAKQWHPTKNGNITPDQVMPGSHRSVWWKCEKGHEWRSLVKSRSQGLGCPVCSNKTIMPGVNDLQTLAPLLAKEWHPSKNGKLTPDQVSCGSSKNVWWRCTHGHEWQATVYSRTDGHGCPICSNRVIIEGENDLQSYAPELLCEWAHDKNNGLLPSQVSAHSNRSVWWRCKLGHEWKAQISARVSSNSSCPYCTGRKVLAGFNDLKTVQPLIADQWHPTFNGQLDPTMVTAGSSKTVWWRCNVGHEWKAPVFSRTEGCDCPYCTGRKVLAGFNDLKTLQPLITEE